MTALAVMSTVAAVLVGGLVPLVALAAYARYRLLQQSRRVFSPRPWLPSQVEPAADQQPDPGTGLSWLALTVGKRLAGTGPDAASAGRTCPHCRYQMTEPAVFCRRCGARIFRG